MDTQDIFTAMDGFDSDDNYEGGRTLVNQGVTNEGADQEPNNVFYLAAFEITYKIAEYINNYYYPTLIFSGIIGNILSFLVMIQPHNRRMSISMYLASIAVSDTIALSLGCVSFLSLGHNVTVPPNQYWYCTCAVSIYFMVATASTFFIVSMTFERFYSIIRPHKAASFNTIKRAKITIAIVILFSILFNVAHFFVTSHQEWLCLPFGDTVTMAKSYFKFYYWCSLVVQFVIPFVLLLTMNSVVIHTLRLRSDLVSKVSNTEDKKTKSNDKQIYVILLLVTFSFLILSTPGYIFYIINLLFDFTKTPKAFAGYYLFSNVAQKLNVTNYGINFFLYVISGKKFRTDLMNVFRFKIISKFDETLNFSKTAETSFSVSAAPT